MHNAVILHFAQRQQLPWKWKQPLR